MSRSVKQPVGQKRLTNIAIVRLRRKGMRFEVACYKNKVGDWRAGIEKDLDEVLQTETVFSNVGKGIIAKDKDLIEAFGSEDAHAICLEILSTGELQVSEGERKIEYQNRFKDVASVLVDKCVNPETDRPYPIAVLERALKDIHFNIDPKKSTKQQALEAVPLLKQRFPIERARMRLRLHAPDSHMKETLQFLEDHHAATESSTRSGNIAILEVLVEPGVFRELHTFVQAFTGEGARVEVLNTAVIGEISMDDWINMPRYAQGSKATESRNTSTSSPVRSKQNQGKTQTKAGVESESDAVIYPFGPIKNIPDEYASRREIFEELDTLQDGWKVELRARGEKVDAIFSNPNGMVVGSFAASRRQALREKKLKSDDQVK